MGWAELMVALSVAYTGAGGLGAKWTSYGCLFKVARGII